MISLDNKLSAYMNIQSVSKPKLIPKKKKITFTSRLSGIPQIWMLDELNKPVQYTFFNHTVRNIYHSPNGEYSIVSVDHNGNEKEQFYLLSDDGLLVEPLVISLEHFHNFGGWSSDGKYFTYSSNRRDDHMFDIYLMNVETKESKIIFKHDDICHPITWLKDDQHILINIPETGLDQNIYILNISTGELTRFGPSNISARYHSFTLLKDKQNGYVITDAGENIKYIGKFSLNEPNRIEKVIHHDPWEIEEIRLSPDETTLIYTVNDGGYYKLHVYDLKTSETKQIEYLPAGVIDSVSFLEDDKILFAVNTPTIPGDLWTYHLKDEQAERLTYISHDGEINHLLIEPELCTFKSFDGLEIPYFYYEKNKDKNKPTVIYVHGGPASQTCAQFNDYIQYLVEQGFAVAAPNVRGSSGYGRKYLAADDIRKRMDSVKDLATLVDDLIKKHHVDPKRIGVMGRSYGGFMVLAATTHYPDLWAAAVNIVGISSFETFMQTTGKWRRKLRGSEYGTIENDLEFFKEIDPIHYTENIDVPMLVYHGLNDTRVPVQESIQLVMKMKEHGQDVRLTIFDDEGHFTERIDNHTTMNSEIVQFMEKHLNK